METVYVFPAHEWLVVDSDNNLLPDQVAHEVLLHRIDRTGEPKYAELVEERIDDFQHGTFKPKLLYIGADDTVKFILIHLYHRNGQRIELGAVLKVNLRYCGYLFGNFASAHLGDFGDLYAVFIQQCNIEYELEVIIQIIPYVGFSPSGLDDIVPLLPDPQGMRLDARKLFQIFYGVNGHFVMCFKSIYYVRGDCKFSCFYKNRKVTEKGKKCLNIIPLYWSTWQRLACCIGITPYFAVWQTRREGQIPENFFNFSVNI